MYQGEPMRSHLGIARLEGIDHPARNKKMGLRVIVGDCELMRVVIDETGRSYDQTGDKYEARDFLIPHCIQSALHQG